MFKALCITSRELFVSSASFLIPRSNLRCTSIVQIFNDSIAKH